MDERKSDKERLKKSQTQNMRLISIFLMLRPPSEYVCLKSQLHKLQEIQFLF